MSRSVTMPAREPFASSTTTEEMPLARIDLATSAKVSLASAVFPSLRMMSPTSIDASWARVPKRTAGQRSPRKGAEQPHPAAAPTPAVARKRREAGMVSPAVRHGFTLAQAIAVAEEIGIDLPEAGFT